MSNDQPESQDLPELEFNLGEAFLRMDEAVAQTIEGLPDFPGFQKRTTLALDCPEEGRESYEIKYTFPENTISSDLTTKEYFAVLKEHWPSIGWEVHGELDDSDGNISDLQAIRPDGVNIWYQNLLGQAVIHAQVACVRSEGDPVCGPPLGGVTPENDNTKYCTLIEPEESESASTDAVAPFEGTQAAMIPWRTDGARRESFDPLGSGEEQG